jgi:hypothetical protein
MGGIDSRTIDRNRLLISSSASILMRRLIEWNSNDAAAHSSMMISTSSGAESAAAAAYNITPRIPVVQIHIVERSPSSSSSSLQKQHDHRRVIHAVAPKRLKLSEDLNESPPCSTLE